MGKKNNTPKRSGFNTQKIFKYVRWIALGAPAAAIAMSSASTSSKINTGVASYTGFDMSTGTWNAKYLARGWMPYAAAAVTTYGIPKLIGIIRSL